MILFKEIFKNEKLEDIPEDHWPNLFRLHYCVNYIRRLYGKPIQVTSGYRSKEDQIRIYQSKGMDLKDVPMRSCHLIGAAIDLYDPQKELQHWILDHLHVSEVLDVYYEHFDVTKDWVHLQIFAPSSRKRFFYP